METRQERELAVYQMLDRLGIGWQRWDHPAVATTTYMGRSHSLHNSNTGQIPEYPVLYNTPDGVPC